MGTYITFPELLIWLPLLTGILCFLAGSEKSARVIAFGGSLLVLGASVASLFYADSKYATYNGVNYYWMKFIGNSFYVGLDGTGRILTLLTAISMPLVLLASFKHSWRNATAFFGLMMLAQCGLMGVFCSLDALLFYFFWELALIPVYFLCSLWGGPRRIPVTFKFFVYTFVGSLLMLIGILYVYQHTPGRMFEDGTNVAHSFAYRSFLAASLSVKQQLGLFALFFLAFAIKMPLFPFHTWQPDTYDQSPTPVTMVLSGVMVKMGLFGVIRWLIPLLPLAVAKLSTGIMWLSVAGIIYASLVAMVQDNLKKLVAYSSIAHIGLMCAALFSNNETGLQGAMVQMFNHGVNIIGMWMVIDVLERRTGVKTISGLSGVASKAPMLSVYLVVIAFANIALPLTNAFVGEMLMFAGLYQHSIWLAAVAGLSVILAAVYTLNMIRKVFLGETSESAMGITDVRGLEVIVLTVIVAVIFITGVYPASIMGITEKAVAGMLNINF